jgi:AraC family transcriptional activator FtrA
MADTAVQTARHRVVGLLVGEVVMFDLAIADQVFGRTDGYTWSVCGVRRGWLPTTTGLAVRVDHGLAALDEADTIVVPGIGDEAWPVPAAALRRLRAAHARGARVISVCTGAFVLAAAGLLDGRRATTHWRYAGLLASSFPAVEVDPAVLYVDHGTIATSAGLAAGIDLCLHLVARDLGADRAAAVARNMVVPPHRRGGQAQFVEALSATHEGTGLAEVLDFMTVRCAEPLTLADLARRAAMSPRTFTRHFRAQTGVSPKQWLLARRLEAARRLLESSDLSVAEIAGRTGFGTPLALRQQFTRVLRTTPTAYRRTFAG